MTDDSYSKLHVMMGNIERRGAWTVPEYFDVSVHFGNIELDFREATLGPGTTTIHVHCRMGNVELIVPEDMQVELNVTPFAGNVCEHRARPADGDPNKPRLRIIGSVKAGNCEVFALMPGESRVEAHDRHRHLRHHARHGRHLEWRRQRFEAIKAERELWMRDGRRSWLPWWLMSRMRRRMFGWFAIAFSAGVAVGVYAWDNPRWWHIVLAFIGLSMFSGAIAYRLTRPMLMAIKAATDIGDGKLDTRLDTDSNRGEMRILAMSLNEMAGKIKQQLADQRQLLAAVSHELRTPLGHMRVLIDTARDTGGTKPLDELQREVLMLDDLVGKLLAQSRLEFGNLDRQPVDLGELVADVATSAGIAAEAIEADGDVHAPIDPTLVRRAVSNLIDNARVHGGGAVAVRIVCRAAQVAIEVDDAGPGVAQDRRADAFRAFVPSSAGGLGLGLSLVSRIAVAHGGGAWISDRPGGGARVGFTIATV